ncbi:MAG TPA: tRNA pseudouridine(38-40) synthase TruA [Methanocorpusculum sp.]|nr:tRNA pseudouridine(38-40) synthase TruA [Methanocorpusculum sp.]
MKLAFTIGYNGRNFSGSQAQPGKRTVEGEFIEACVNLGLFTNEKEAHFLVSGRTDKGVSARKQIVSITTEKPKKAIDALNFWLPNDIWCLGAAEVPSDFYPRYAVRSRTYRYYFPYAANIAEMDAAAQQFIGRHNFTRFSKMEKGRNPNRTILAAKVFAAQDGCPVFEISADSFLWNMVRGMAGFLAAVGTGVVESKIVSELLTKPGNRMHPAPAEALILWDTECNISFTPMKLPRETMRILGRESAAARAEMRVLEALMNEQPTNIWKRQLIREYPNLYKRENNRDVTETCKN